METYLPELPIRILLVEDELAHVKLMLRALRSTPQPHEVFHVGTLAAARRFCAEKPPDLAIVDLVLPDGRGTELLSSDGKSEYPVIILTSQGDERAAVQAIKAGACDYVIKSGEVIADMPHIVRRALREWQLLQDRETALRALAENNRVFRELADNIRDLFWLYDWIDKRLLYVSQAYEAVWGYEAASLIENPEVWIERVHEDDRERIVDMPLPEKSGPFYDKMYRIVRPDGGLRWIHDRRFAVFNSAGEFYRIVGVCEDVTERQELAEKIQQQAGHLAHVARLSTMGELIAGIAHEVNQPLHTIANYTATIAAALEREDTVSKEKLKQWNGDIARAVTRAADIIKRTRAYLSKGSPQRVGVNINLLVEESAELMAFEARDKHSRVKLVLERPSSSVMADPVAIQQVVVNLLRNAFEAMEREPTRRRVVGVRTHRSGDLVEVAVADSGVGMSDDAVKSLFTPFNTSKPQGMGMGLAISKTIIEAHHGHIWATANADRGMTFHFTLPATPAPAK